MASVNNNGPVVWVTPAKVWLLLIVAAMLLGAIFHSAIQLMVTVWNTRESYSYGYLIPVITGFMIWQKKDFLREARFMGSWGGVVVTLLGLVLFVLGTLSTATTLVQYSLIIVIIGVAISMMGWDAAKRILVPLLFLVFMVPWPSFILNNLSEQLKLLSSALGVDVIRLLGIPVFLGGNVIDLGEMKLQVATACSGLRYLFPLMSLAFISAYLFKASLWKRAIVFLSSIPLTIVMNSLRIGVIGILVHYWGITQAQGFLHAFEGWSVFMLCFGIIIGEIWILARTGDDRQTLQQAFGLELPAPVPENAERRRRGIPKQAGTAVGVLMAAAIGSHFLIVRPEIHPKRATFATFPMTIGDWRGQRGHIAEIYLNELKLTDYIIANYTQNNRRFVNFYAAYYASQKTGDAIHSPHSCIPGGGWKIETIARYRLKGVMVDGVPLVVDRLVIEKGGNKELVYYWFQEQGRVLTSEYLAKWYLFWDALTRDRTDGALVRLITPISANGNTTAADARLTDFAKAMTAVLGKYVPGYSRLIEMPK
jgi:exosortase D (VPLPA-CTERM-specific)